MRRIDKLRERVASIEQQIEDPDPGFKREGAEAKRHKHQNGFGRLQAQGPRGHVEKGYGARGEEGVEKPVARQEVAFHGAEHAVEKRVKNGKFVVALGNQNQAAAASGARVGPAQDGLVEDDIVSHDVNPLPLQQVN